MRFVHLARLLQCTKIIYMSDEGDLCTSKQRVGEITSRTRHPDKVFLPQKEHIPCRKNTKGGSRTGERS